MSKVERWLTLVANLSVVAGIIYFLAAEMRQNTAAIQAQTMRDPEFNEIWQSRRGFSAPDFQAEIDRIVAEVERAQ